MAKTRIFSFRKELAVDVRAKDFATAQEKATDVFADVADHLDEMTASSNHPALEWINLSNEEADCDDEDGDRDTEEEE